MKIKLNMFILFILLSNSMFSHSIKITNHYGSENKEIQDLIDFESIYIEQLNFEGETLKGKSYQIALEEYIEGRLAHITMLFDGTESDYFKISSSKETVKFFFKFSEDKLKIFIRGNRFGSKKSYFHLSGDYEKYALKDFFGNKKELLVSGSSKTTIFAIITPTIHEDGSASYCEVVQANEKPEKLGERFKIPHYFLLTITFQ